MWQLKETVKISSFSLREPPPPPFIVRAKAKANMFLLTYTHMCVCVEVTHAQWQCYWKCSKMLLCYPPHTINATKWERREKQEKFLLKFACILLLLSTYNKNNNNSNNNNNKNKHKIRIDVADDDNDDDNSQINYL